MKILDNPATTKAGTDRFIGDAWFDLIIRGDPPSRVRASVVRFAPGARNHWHRHAVGQVFHVTDGIGRTQARGGDVIEIRAGDTVHTPPGEWHWHGAAPDRFMTHFTVYEATDDGAETDWGDPVGDDEYAAQPVRPDR
jgi:quercetin dioxygenase-like cupin family protein